MRASAKCNSQNRGVDILSLELWWLIDCTHFMFYRHAPMALILHVIVAMASGVIKSFLLKPWILLNRATDSLELWFLLFIGNRSIKWNRRSQQTMIRFHLNIFLNSLLLLGILSIPLLMRLRSFWEPSRTQKILSLSVLKRCMNHGNVGSTC